MNKKLIQEIEEMKNMFRHKRGVVISEQNYINESSSLDDLEIQIDSIEEGDEESKKRKKILKKILECLRENDNPPKLALWAKLLMEAIIMGGGILIAIKSGLDLLPGVAFGAFAAGKMGKEMLGDLDELCNCVALRLDSDGFPSKRADALKKGMGTSDNMDKSSTGTESTDLGM